MKAERAVRNLLAAWESHNLSQTARLLTPNFKLIGLTPKPLNREEFLMFQRVYNEAFPNWKFNLSDIEVQGHEVHLTAHVRATHAGVFDASKLGIAVPRIPPTGKARSWPVEYLTCNVKSGKITRIDIETRPAGKLLGTLAWLGVELPTGLVT